MQPLKEDPEEYYEDLFNMRKTLDLYFANEMGFKCEYAARSMEYFFNIPIAAGVNKNSEGWHAIGKLETDVGTTYVDIIQGKQGQTSEKVLIGPKEDFPWFEEHKDGAEQYQKNIQNDDFQFEMNKIIDLHEQLNDCRDLPYRPR